MREVLCTSFLENLENLNREVVETTQVSHRALEFDGSFPKVQKWCFGVALIVRRQIFVVHSEWPKMGDRLILPDFFLVRLFRCTGLQGPARRRVQGDTGELESSHHHD